VYGHRQLPPSPDLRTPERPDWALEERGVHLKKIFGSPWLSIWDENLMWFSRGLVWRREDLAMKHKKLDAETLVHSEKVLQDILIAPTDAARKCLAYLTQTRADSFKDEGQRKLYLYVKGRLSEMSEGAEKDDVRIALIIERLAFMTVLLDSADRLALINPIISKEDLKEFKYTPVPQDAREYVALCKEYRQTIETLVNLKYILHRKQKVQNLELLRDRIANEREQQEQPGKQL
jgi:hypothetical protein